MNTFLVTSRRILAFTTVLAATTAGPLLANEVLHWNEFAVQTTSQVMPHDPCTESLILATVHLAMHDAANHIEPRFETFASCGKGVRDASFDAAVASAAYHVLREFLPKEAAKLESEYTARVGAIPEAPAKSLGIDLGKTVALDVVRMRLNDGSLNARTWEAGVRPGEYRPTPPDFTPAAASHWGEIRPFSLSSAAQFRPPAPDGVDSTEAVGDREEVRAFGGTQSRLRTAEQGEIAKYWYEHSTRGWNRIARTLAASRGLDGWEQARLLALVNVAMADGFIAGFEAKYHYNYWRPATAIRENGDAEWLSYLPTPPVPDYPSTHTVLGAAAATVMARILGTDFVSFSMTSGEPYAGITRHFWSLSEAAQENGSSRVLAGLHFTNAVQAGYRQGVQVGEWVAARALRPGAANAVRITLRD